MPGARFAKSAGTEKLAGSCFVLCICFLCGTKLCLPQPGSGLRFCLVTREAFVKLSEAKEGLQSHVVNGIGILKGDVEFGPPHANPHPALSQWLVDEGGLNSTEILYQKNELIDQVLYGQGFGGWPCSTQKGTNRYLGKQSSDQSNPTIVEGPGQAGELQYHRSPYKLQIFCPYLDKRIRNLLVKFFLFSRQMNYALDEFIKMNQPCALWTQGILGDIYSFVDEDMHIDGQDHLQIEVEQSMMEEAHSKIPPDASTYTKSALSYLEQLAASVGLRYSTTCAYHQHVFHSDVPKKDIKVIQFSTLAGLG
jgi:hypothetical protein